MPLCNRVDPFGTIHAAAARGLFTGNRGVIHDPDTKTLLRRRWTTKAWIVCRCEFRGVRRDVMGLNARSGRAGWTELFFLDEVTALGAGHRPCFFCRREAATAFAAAFATGNGMARANAPAIDARLHAERFTVAGRTPPLAQPIESLPDGAVIARGGEAFAIRGSRPVRWTFGGYEEQHSPAIGREADWRLLTPLSTLRTLSAGFRPVWHPSIDGPAQQPVSRLEAPTGFDSGEPR